MTTLQIMKNAKAATQSLMLCDETKKNEIFCFKMSGNKNYYKFVFDWNMYKTGSISESLTPYPPVTDEKYPCQDEGNG